MARPTWCELNSNVLNRSSKKADTFRCLTTACRPSAVLTPSAATSRYSGASMTGHTQRHVEFLPLELAQDCRLPFIPQGDGGFKTKPLNEPSAAP